jgi:hypothetical protein
MFTSCGTLFQTIRRRRYTSILEHVANAVEADDQESQELFRGLAERIVANDNELTVEFCRHILERSGNTVHQLSFECERVRRQAA